MPSYRKNIVASQLHRIKDTIEVLELHLSSLKEDLSQLTLELEELNLGSSELATSSQGSNYIPVDYFNKPIKVGDLVKSRTYPKHNGTVHSFDTNWVYIQNSKNQRKYKKAHNLVNQSYTH